MKIDYKSVNITRSPKRTRECLHSAIKVQNALICCMRMCKAKAWPGESSSDSCLVVLDVRVIECGAVCIASPRNPASYSTAHRV